MKEKLRIFGAIVLLFLLIAPGCRNAAIIPESPAISFSADIQPILAGNCQMEGCHGNGGGEDAEPLMTYEEVMDNGGIEPFHAHGSKLYEAVIGEGENSMPPSPYNKLQAPQLMKIYLWIMQGAENN